jgi:hypothetical protein
MAPAILTPLPSFDFFSISHSPFSLEKPAWLILGGTPGMVAMAITTKIAIFIRSTIRERHDVINIACKVRGVTLFTTIRMAGQVLGPDPLPLGIIPTLG